MPTLSTTIATSLQARNTLLWVCQPYDLCEGEDPHGYSDSPSDVILRYREQVDQTDEGIASLFWEAVWLEGAKSPLLSAFRKAAQDGGRPVTNSL